MAEVYPTTWAEVENNRIGWGSKPALILIDVCTSYWSPKSAHDLNHNPAGKASPDSMRRVLAAARRGGIPVLWTQVYYTDHKMRDAGVSCIKSPGLNIWQKGDTRGFGDCLPGLEPQPSDFVIQKHYPSAFIGTPLQTTLHMLGADTLVVCGVSTSGCCRATTIDAMAYGFRPIIIDEASGDRSPELQASTLFDIQSRYGDVASEAEAIEKLAAGWQ